MRPEHLIIFVKAPRVGAVKTRLARSVGAEAACAAYCRLVEILIDQLADLPDVELRFSPDDAADESQRWLRQGWRAKPQGPGDLGERMQRTFHDAFNDGAQRVVIIGSDCPAIKIQDIQAAWAGLKDHDLVLGPAKDCGYWLIGLRQPQPQLFQRIDWSTSSVLQKTLERAQTAALRAHLLRELSDIDSESDWREFLASHATCR